jgi:hypothetical protein
MLNVMNTESHVLSEVEYFVGNRTIDLIQVHEKDSTSDPMAAKWCLAGENPLPWVGSIVGCELFRGAVGKCLAQTNSTFLSLQMGRLFNGTRLGMILWSVWSLDVEQGGYFMRR